MSEILEYTGLKFGLALTPNGNQPLDTRTIVKELPATASDFIDSAAYEGMVITLLSYDENNNPKHQLYILESNLSEILAGSTLKWKKVGNDTEALEGYFATKEYVQDEIEKLTVNSASLWDGTEITFGDDTSYIASMQEFADNVTNLISDAQKTGNDAKALAQTAYNMAYTVAYGEGVADAIDTIKDITYWLNNDPNNAVDLITRMSKVEEELSSLENYDDTELRKSISENTSYITLHTEDISYIKEEITYIYKDIDSLEQTVATLKNYDDTELRSLIKTNADKIDANSKLIAANTEDISYIYQKIENIESNGYDDSELRSLIKNNLDAIAEIKNIDLGDSNLWKDNQTGEALIITYEGEIEKEILSIYDYTEYIKKQSSLQWDIL